MKIFVGCDHAAFNEKKELLSFLRKEFSNFQFIDVGTENSERCDYPDFAIRVAEEVSGKGGDVRGILLCGSGIGMSMAANRFRDIRAALCRSEEDARLSREHNDANILCLGARTNTISELQAMAKVWLRTGFEAGRHVQRIEIFNDLGESLEQ